MARVAVVYIVEDDELVSAEAAIPLSLISLQGSSGSPAGLPGVIVLCGSQETEARLRRATRGYAREVDVRVLRGVSKASKGSDDRTLSVRHGDRVATLDLVDAEVERNVAALRLATTPEDESNYRALVVVRPETMFVKDVTDFIEDTVFPYRSGGRGSGVYLMRTEEAARRDGPCDGLPRTPFFVCPVSEVRSSPLNIVKSLDDSVSDALQARDASTALLVVLPTVSALASELLALHTADREGDRAEDIRFFPICISSRPERVRCVRAYRAHVEAIAAKRGRPWTLEVVEAVDGKAELDAAKLGELRASGFLASEHDAYMPGRPIVVNQVAAFLSHRRALGRIADLAGSAITFGVVLEDDLVIDDRDAFESAVEAASEVLRRRPEVGLVQLYVMPAQRSLFRPGPGFSRKAARLAEDRVGRWTVVPKPTVSWGSHAYAVRPRAARLLLDDHMWPMLGAIDEQLARASAATGINAVALLGPDEPVREDLENAPSVVALGGRTAPGLTFRAPDVRGGRPFSDIPRE